MCLDEKDRLSHAHSQDNVIYTVCMYVKEKPLWLPNELEISNCVIKEKT